MTIIDYCKIGQLVNIVGILFAFMYFLGPDHVVQAISGMVTLNFLSVCMFACINLVALREQRK